MIDARAGGVRGRFARTLPILPVLLAEAILWLGFGALLPVLPLYIVEQGIDIATLGWIVAAWPATRLLGEPIFGWLADRGDKRLLMLGGLLATAVVVPMPLVLTGVPAFLLARGLAGLATAAYDPAARAYILDATPPDERGAAFGLYSSAQMGGLLLGPAFGGIGAALGGGYVFPFVFCSVAVVAAAVLLGLTIMRRPVPGHVADDDAVAAAAADAPASLWNRLLIAAIVIDVGSFFASGTYEVIWSIWMTELGADLGLIGLSFATFGLGVLVLSPIAGRWSDQRGPLLFIVLGSLGAAAAGILYSLLQDPILVLPVVFCEGVSFALLGPALYSVVAHGTPVGRSATTQGVYGAAGTMGTIVASIAAGVFFAIDIHLPFYVFAVVMVASLALGLAIGGRELRALGPAPEPPPKPVVPPVPDPSRGVGGANEAA
ncbi:MAG TPA: MFS transporter [Candidatus Nanopelagicales bacterium]|nr:MFS transporter [Candidatus Nanopelagicales bacterium]